MRERKFRRPGAGGFTLIEVLIGIVLLSLIAIAVAAISLPGVLRMTDDSQERQRDATAAQWTSLVFARDVQGASGLGSECASVEGGTRLVTLVASDGTSPSVEYWVTGSDPYELVRAECPGESRVVVRDLKEAAPTVECRESDETLVVCDSPTTPPDFPPRTITLQVSPPTGFGFLLDGVRRPTGADGGDDPENPPPLKAPEFFALGGGAGGAEPLYIGGTSKILVKGSAYINGPDSGNTAVRFVGAPNTLTVTEDFRLQDGAVCRPDCSNATPSNPGSFSVRLPDPLRILPPPPMDSLTEQTDCPVEIDGDDKRRVCKPGIYKVEFPPSADKNGGVKNFDLEPGTYVLRDGLRMSNGSLTGGDVLIYNESGAISSEGADLTLGAPASGLYEGILLFQARDNKEPIKIKGNTSIASLTGTIYAPDSDGVELGSGNAGMTVGRIIGTGLSTSGTGTVTVGGG